MADKAIRAAKAIEVRHTDRRPVTGTPIDDARLNDITAALEREGARLHMLPRDGVIELGVATSPGTADRGHSTGVADRTGVLDRWHPAGAGVPDTAILLRPTETTVASRDFGHPGGLPVSAEHDQGRNLSVLCGEQNDALDWLRAGEALSAGWLTATELGVSLVPMSATIEVIADPGRAAPAAVRAGRAVPGAAPRLHRSGGRASPGAAAAGTPDHPTRVGARRITGTRRARPARSRSGPPRAVRRRAAGRTAAPVRLGARRGPRWPPRFPPVPRRRPAGGARRRTPRQ